MRKQPTILMTAAGALLLFGAGCGGRTIYSGPGGAVREERKGEYTITNQQTGDTLTIGSSRLPKNFPADIPIYRGAAITTSQVAASQSIVSLQTPDKSADVLAWYKAELPKQGWTVDTETSAPTVPGPSTLLGATKSDGASLLLTIGPDQTKKSDDKVIVIIRTNPQQ